MCSITGQTALSHADQLVMWQQDSYLNAEDDSGVISGALSVSTPLTDDLLFDWDPTSHGLGSQFAGSLSMEQGMEVVEQQINQSASQRVPPVIFPEAMEEQMDISSSQFAAPEASNVQMLQHGRMVPATAMLSTPSESSFSAARALPDLMKLLNDEDQVVVAQATATVHQMSKTEPSLHVIMRCPQMVASIIKALTNSNDTETTRCASGALHNLSQYQDGRAAIFRADGVRALVKLLSSPLEGVLFYAITTLHNLLLHQEGAKTAVQIAGGLQKMVSLLQRNNTKFLAIVTDCLQILAYGNQEAKLCILASGGPAELLRILRTSSYEKLLWTTTRVLKVLSVCSSNKPAIVESGGVEVLTRHLTHQSNRLVLNCLFTLRNISDAAIPQENIENLLQSLVRLLLSPNMDIVTCAAGALSNLTCNNQRNKSIVYRIGGCETLVHTVNQAWDREEITEPAICALRHLTCRHPEAELAQQAIRKSYGIQAVAKLFNGSRWPLRKAIIGLIRNLALHQENHVQIREHNIFHIMVDDLQKATEELLNSQGAGLGRPKCEGVKMVEIIDGIVGALHILAKEPLNRALIRSLRTFPLFIQLMFIEIENIQRGTSRLLCELASDRDSLLLMESENLFASLEHLTRSPNQTTVTIATAVLAEVRSRLWG